MNIRPREDIKPLSVMRTRPASLLRQVRENQRPIVITQRGKPSAVIIDLDDYERQKEKMELMEAVLEGERDIKEHRIKSLDQVHRETRRWVGEK